MTRQIYDDIWEQFASGDHISQMPHQESIGVGLGVRIQTPDIVERISFILLQLEQLGVFAPTPLDALHLTVRNLGTLGDHLTDKQTVSPKQLPILIESIGRALTGVHQFEVDLRRVNSFSICPIVEVHDNGRILAIRQRIETELSPLGLTDYDYGPRGFVPHLTLGYYTRNDDGATIRQALRALRETDIGRIQVTELMLIQARLALGVCCLEPIHTFELQRETGTQDDDIQYNIE